MGSHCYGSSLAGKLTNNKDEGLSLFSCLAFGKDGLSVHALEATKLLIATLTLTICTFYFEYLTIFDSIFFFLPTLK